MRHRSGVEERVLTVTAMEIIKGLRRLLVSSSRKVAEYLRMVIRKEGIVPEVHDEGLPH
jgi:hypothetical protein